MANDKTLLDFDPWLEPYRHMVEGRDEHVKQLQEQFLDGASVSDAALGHVYFGLHKNKDSWTFREWAPNATSIYLIGDFNNWQIDETFRLKQLDGGKWEVKLPLAKMSHGDKYKLHVFWPGGDGHRIPSYANRAVQDNETLDFAAQVWSPPDKQYVWHDKDFAPGDARPLIYEAHVGMAGQQEGVSSYAEFTRNVLPRIKDAGYNTVQLMAVAEHPYYGSFGYHVSNFFAPSSRFGTPEELKALVDTAHGMGLRVLIDIVHSHAAKNEAEGLSNFAGDPAQYFYEGERGTHSAWDSRCFDYGKPEVLHFLLSNCRYWMDEFHFDGLRFDGITSMLYADHGLERDFTSYDDYFGDDIDDNALMYLRLANQLIHTIKPGALTIAEDVSAMPGLALPVTQQGIGFDYRLSMGVPDIWIKVLKEKRDEDWNLDALFHELTTRRPEERVISYAESHDQALVGDKTLIFRLIDQEMYWHMRTDDADLTVERGIALHKMIRLVTAATNGGGYLNFMGNEFGHPEWIDFPRVGNDWSYKYARRQWDLLDNEALKYKWLARFDRAMTAVIADVTAEFFDDVHIKNQDGVMAFRRGDYMFVCNFSPGSSYTDYGIAAPEGDYRLVLSSDDAEFGGQSRVDTAITYPARDHQLSLYLPARTAVVLRMHRHPSEG